MKRMILAVLSVVLLPVLATAQEQGWAAKFFSGGLTHNFGNVAFGAQLSHKFTITNIYNVPFKVTSATVSCGCVEAKKPDVIIPPRGTAEIEALMNTRRIPAGQLNMVKSVNVFVNLTSVPEKAGDKIFSSNCTLVVSCVARTDIVFSADRINYGVIQAGQTPKQTIDIQNVRSAGWQITGVVSNKLPIDVEIQPLQARLPNQSYYRVLVTLKKDAPAGEFKHEVQLQTNDQQTPVLNLVVEGVVQAPLIAAPNSISLGDVKVNAVVTRNVIVRGNGTPFKVTGIAGDGKGIKVRLPEKAATAHLIMIEFQPTQAGSVNETLTLKTDLEGGMSTTVTVSGNAIP